MTRQEEREGICLFGMEEQEEVVFLAHLLLNSKE